MKTWKMSMRAAILLAGIFFCMSISNGSKALAAERISVQEARAKVLAGQALLVCAYESDERFNPMRLDGAMSFSEFNAQFDRIAKDRMIVFYCA